MSPYMSEVPSSPAAAAACLDDVVPPAPPLSLACCSLSSSPLPSPLAGMLSHDFTVRENSACARIASFAATSLSFTASFFVGLERLFRAVAIVASCRRRGRGI